MNNRQRLGNILGAGTVTAFVLILFLVFGQANATPTTTAPFDSTPSITLATDTGPTTSDAALELQNGQLRQALDTMQNREAEYQTQIDLANQALEQFQTQSAEASYEYEEEEEEHDED